jgi:stage II sporulation protein D
MPSTWNPEALKAQAVAARSYAYVTAQTARSRSWDLTATATSQVYGGLSAANARTDKAIAATTGQVITWEDEPALAYYHSHSGGMLEDDASVWGADLPFYKVQKDDASRHEKEMSWSYSVSGDAVARACRKNGYAVRWVADIAPGEISGSGRVTSFVLKTDKGDITVKANALRNWINPTRIKSLLCRVRRKGNNDFVFYGRGWGHGVGLSQYGASRLAKTGRKHQQILAAYYPGTKVGKMY